MSDVVLVLVVLGFFALAIGLVGLLDRIVSGGADPGGAAEEQPEAGRPGSQ